MASGDTVGQWLGPWEFDDTYPEIVVLQGVASGQYTGRKLVAFVAWRAADLNPNPASSVAWQLFFRLFGDRKPPTDWSAAPVAPAYREPEQGQLTYTRLEIPRESVSLEAGQLFEVRLVRDVGRDSLVGNAVVHAVELVEH